MDIQEQIVITRARANYLSEQPDRVDTNMHNASADTLEKLYAVYLAAEDVLPIDVVTITDANYMSRLEFAVTAVREQP